MTTKWAIVPVVATPKMIKAGADAWLDCASRLALNKAGAAVNAGISASPGADLLAEILAARDAYIDALPERLSQVEFNLISALEKLGGSND